MPGQNHVTGGLAQMGTLELSILIYTNGRGLGRQYGGKRPDQGPLPRVQLVKIISLRVVQFCRAICLKVAVAIIRSIVK